jgi:methanogenesis imperfect marker protein 11
MGKPFLFHCPFPVTVPDDGPGEWLTPDEVHARHGDAFCRGFLTLVDPARGRVRIIEECTVKGTVEWDMWNRLRARGVCEAVRVEGTTLVMDARIGEEDLHFGPAASEMGAQALRRVEVVGDEVRTTWVGLAGAGYALVVCLAQAPGVLRSRRADGTGVGGAHRAEVEVVTPALRRLLVGIDDTDTRDEGATWALGLRLGRAMPHGRFLEHRLVQLNPGVEHKTTNCVATALEFAVAPSELDRAKAFALEFVSAETRSLNTAVAFFEGLEVPASVVSFGRRAKGELLTWEEAKRLAAAAGVDLVSVTGERGHIGALAAIGCFDLGAAAAALPSDLDARRAR